jgi:hemoglobin-like flavoprotein
MSNLSLYERLNDENFNKLVEVFYQKIIDDYRVTRFFCDDGQKEQLDALKALAKFISQNNSTSDDEFKALLTRFFMSSFARFKEKEAYPESSLAFFGYIISQDNPSSKLLCDSHGHLLKFMPDDSHYDVVIEHLINSLQELGIDGDVIADIVTLVESGRNSLLGK